MGDLYSFGILLFCVSELNHTANLMYRSQIRLANATLRQVVYFPVIFETEFLSIFHNDYLM